MNQFNSTSQHSGTCLTTPTSRPPSADDTITELSESQIMLIIPPTVSCKTLGIHIIMNHAHAHYVLYI